MKILGKSQRGFIMEISQEEFANVCGFTYFNPDFIAFLRTEGAYSPTTYNADVIIGADVPIGKWWHQLRQIRSKADELQKLSNTLRGPTYIVGRYNVDKEGEHIQPVFKTIGMPVEHV